jgi:glycosyltransferase involved in cell wall biosynthesis
MELNKSQVYITIPLYNDAAMILSVIKSLTNCGYKNIVVVDDGSKDNGYELVQSQTQAIVAKHIINRGQGATLRTAMEIALDNGAKYIIHFDSDGQHDVRDLDNMVETLITGKYDIVLGSRFLKKNDIPIKKRILLKGAIIFTFLLSGICLTDVHNGLRALTAETARKLDLQHDRMEHASEILDKIKLLKLKYTEVPVTIHYTKYSMAKGQSIFNSLNIAWKLILAKLK